MLKWMLMTVLRCGSFLCANEGEQWQEDCATSIKEEFDWEDRAEEYLTLGFESLLAHKPSEALLQFESALSFLDRPDSLVYFIKCMISYGQAVAYDCLGLQEECSDACLAVVSHALTMADIDDDGEHDGEEMTQEEYEDFVKFRKAFKKAPHLAPTKEVRDFLLVFSRMLD